jgi:hypothetical protein
MGGWMDGWMDGYDKGWKSRRTGWMDVTRVGEVEELGEKTGGLN